MNSIIFRFFYKWDDSFEIRHGFGLMVFEFVDFFMLCFDNVVLKIFFK
jgi:hypothetical protein